MYTLIYFSPTGNAKHLAHLLAENLEPNKVDVLPLEFTNPTQLKPNKHLVLVYPVHGFNAPRTVKRFVKNLPSGLFSVVSLIAVGCNTTWFNAAVSSDLRRVLKKKSYPIALDEMMAMPLTFIMNFPDKLNFKLITLAEMQIKEISEAIINEKVSVNKVRFKSRLITFLGKIESPAARMFGLELHANKNCTSCGTCWNNCPEKNIRQGKKDKPKFAFKCSMCMRCIYSCPEKAISPWVSKFIPIKNGYSLKKYIKD